MIFKTFDSDIDNMSSRWGMFGKSFSDIGDTITTKWKQVTDYVAVTNDATISGMMSAWKGTSPVQFLSDDSVVNVLNDYNKALDKGAEATAKFFEAGTGNDFMNGWLKQLKGAPATMDDYKAAVAKAELAQNGLTASMVASKVAALALNVAVSMGVSIAISALIKLVDNLVHANEKAIEKAEELRDKYNDFKETNASNVKTLNDLKDEFEELSDGVSQYGDNISLTTEQYARYQEIVQQIVGMSPSLAEGYDTENGYIADKNGLLERAIELQEIEYRNELRKITNLDNLKTSMSGYIAEYKEALNGGYVTAEGNIVGTTIDTDFKNSLWELFNTNNRENYDGQSMARDIMDALGVKDIDKEIQKYINEYGYWQDSDFWNDYCDQIANNLDAVTNSLSAEEVGLDDTVFDQNIEKLESYAEKYNDMKDSVKSANESIQTDLGYIAEYADGYSDLSKEQQKFVTDYLKGFDISDITSENSMGILEYDEDKMASVKSQIKKFVEELSHDNSTKQALTDLYAPPSDNETIEEYKNRIDSALEVIRKYCEANGIEIPVGISDVEDSATNLESSYKQTIENAKEKYGEDLTPFFKENSINTQEEIDKWREIAQSCDTATEAKKKYLEADTSQETSTSFEIPDAETLKQQISDLNSAIDSIQSAYDTLNSAVEEYNSNGGQLSIDTIQSLLSLSDEYLACLQVENGQLSLNADAMAQLAQSKLDEAQATAVTQAMTELQAIANGEAAQSTTNYITGNAALMSSLAQLSGSYEGVAQAAMTAAQAQELSAQISAASAKDKTATENVMKGLDTKLKLIQSTKNAISAGNFASVAKKSSSGSSSKSSKSSTDELKEQFQAEYDLLKHNLEMEYITEEDYYNGVQDLNEKYFAGKEEYLDEYRKYEEEVYKGLKSYYKSYCDDMMDYYDKKLDASKMSYKEYCDSVSKMLADMHNSGKISDKDWYDYTKTMLEKQKDAYDRALSAITRRLQKEIDAWQAKIDVLNDQNDALNDQKDNYDKILSAVSNVYDKEIDRLNEQKDLLQDQIDALNDKNDALDLQYRKEQALYALQKAQQQRTRKLYVEGKGYIYDTDNEAIRDAQKDLDDITNEELINSLQKEQDKIQESIDILEKYKEKWNEIPDAWDKAVSEQLAIELWGQEYEKLILMNRTSDIENFKTKYLKIQSQINDNEQLIKSYEEKVEYYTKLKEQWQSLTDEYSNSVDDMYAKMLLGQSWEADVLNGRLSTLNDFRNQYNDIQKSISDMAWQSANAQISALNAVKAAEATKAQTSGGSNGYSGSSGNVSSVSKPSQPKKDTVQHYWIYRTLGIFNTNGQASSKIGMLGGDGVISVGGKYLVVKWKKGYVTRGEASSNIVNYGGNGVYKRYASGTDNAKKGWNIVSEENPELIIRNNGEIDLAKGEQFYNFQGGEKVIPANETKEILKNQGNVEQLSDSDVITRKDGSILKPIHYEYENMLTNFIKDNPDYMYSMNTMSDNMCRDLFKNAENVNYDNRSVDNKVSIGEIHLHEVPNVDQFARELDRQLAGIVDQKLSRRKR